MGWSPDYPDPDNYLRISHWQVNSGWQHPEYDALVNDARRIADQDQRMAMYRQAELILVKEAPLIPISYGLRHHLIKPWFRPWSNNLNYFIFKDVIMEEH